MKVTEDSWVTLSVEGKGPVKCVSLLRDKKRILSLGRRGTFPVISLLGAPLNIQLFWDGNALRESENIKHAATKHERKKAEKHSNTLTLKRPTLPDLLSMYAQKGDLTLSHEVLSQILFHAVGVKYVGVKDEYKSMVLGAVATARGTNNLYRIDGHTNTIHTLQALGFTADLKKYNPESITGAEEFLFILAQKEKYNPTEVLNLLKRSPVKDKGPTDFLLYHPVKEGLLDVFNTLMEESAVCLLDLRELFYREYQITTGATHPFMSKRNKSGFLLSGTFLDNSSVGKQI